MRVLLIGSGGREHALAWKLAQSPRLARLFCAPGNPGTARMAENVALTIDDHHAVIDFCTSHAVDLVVIGPEQPLVAGLGDALRGAGIAVFGPDKAAAHLEGSKAFTKALCDEAGIPTARYSTFNEANAAKAYAAGGPYPIVIKSDGLAAGKGVAIAAGDAEAEAAIEAACADGGRVVIEEFLVGEEASLFVLCDGETILPLAAAQDHKRAFDGDTGPNTGGMGAYSPAPILDDTMMARALAEIVEPTIAAMKARGTPYSGVLYAGLMITADGPKLIEYNCRFGDPECQILMLRLRSDLLVLLDATARGILAGRTVEWDPRPAITVVMATKGYPGPVQKGFRIDGLDRVEAAGVTVFHAGTRVEGERIVSNGGRVLNLCALGATLAQARDAAYRGVDALDWRQGFCRRDIGVKGL